MALGAYYGAQKNEELELEESDYPSQFPKDVSLVKAPASNRKYGLNKYGYHSGRKSLYVNAELSGDVYVYHNVPSSVWNAMNDSENVGEFYKNNIKGKFKYRRIDKDFYEAKNEGVELDEAKISSPKQRADLQRVQYGAMSRDEYDKKWKLGKYKTGSPRNKLTGPGGLYKNLVKKEETELEESANMPKIKELVSLALIDEKDVPATIAALKATQSDKTLTPAQTKLLGNLAVMLANVILGDTSALSSVKRAAKE